MEGKISIQLVFQVFSVNFRIWKKLISKDNWAIEKLAFWSALTMNGKDFYFLW